MPTNNGASAVLLLGLLVTGCSDHGSKESAMEVQFLTRDGCAGSPEMHDHLVTAAASLGFEVEVVTVDVGSLPEHDYRTGFGTPTVLVHGEDLFGMPRPEAASPT